MGPLLKKLRIEEKISPIKDNYEINPLLTPENQPMMKSRFHISWDELHNVVNPAIAEMLRVHNPNIVCLPRFIELNLLEILYSSLFFSLFSSVPWRNEWLEDTVKKIDQDGTLIDQGDRLLVGY